MTISAVKAELSRLVDMASRGEQRILIEEAGAPVAALVSAADLFRLDQLERDWESGTRAMERLSETFADVPVDELESRIDEIIAEGRARDAAQRRSA